MALSHPDQDSLKYFSGGKAKDENWQVKNL